ncbi:hypothetical protein [Devosia sp.]|uniref:hypothetical protein n=1 Tax=Devosia sp. TaxID=1871048 RepID=UPI001B10A6EC|nr:hypothetical protein [Devosia sp.]MBO9589062.1 hypothetical protein [Devosia sp.]
MSGSARIGALHVMLGLDSAQFTAGLAKAQNGMAKFAKAAGVGMAAVAAAGTAAATAFAFAIKGAIDNADRMGEIAQSLGITVEALSSLGYVAKMSGTDVETLSVGLKKLSQNMLAVAEGAGGTAGSAFQMLGVKVKDAEGNLRSSDQVLIDIAEKFAGMEAGALKTATAIRLFGKSGADLIPLLDQGRDGIAALTAEADRLGITISGATAAAAGRFNDALDRMQSIADGFTNKVMAGVVPALDKLATKLAESATSFGGLQVAVDVSIWLFKQFLQFVAEAEANLNSMAQTIYLLGRAFEFIKLGNMQGALEQLGDIGVVNDQIFKDLKVTIDDIWSGADGGGEGTGTGFTPLIPDIAEIKAAQNEMKKLADEGKRVFEATRTPAEKMSLEIDRLNKLLDAGAIDWDTYNRAMKQAQDDFAEAELAGNKFASTIADGLANIFGQVIDGSKSAVDAVAELTKQLGMMTLQEGFRGLMGGLLSGVSGGGGIGGIFSGLFGGGGLKLGYNLPSFDGGGSTGSGSRAGGLDGRGGFLAMLHPDETVFDHTSSRSGGTQGGDTYNIDARGAQKGVGAEIAQALADFSKNTLPSRVQQIQRNPHRR